MNARTYRFSRFCFRVIGAAALMVFCGQGVHAQTPATNPIQQPDGTLTKGVTWDWSMRHLVFSNPGTADQAIAKGTYEKWAKIVNNPRYILQQKRQLLAETTSAAAKAAAAAPKSSGTANESSEAAAATGNAAKKKGTTTRDWSLPLGIGGVARNMWPAKYSSTDTSGAPGPPPTGYCIADFFVAGLNVVSTTLQANLIAIDDLYSGTGGACGATPKVKWAYNTSTSASGTITTSPVLSADGTQVAFVESTGTGSGGESIFHVLRWKDATGTASVTAPTKPTGVASTVGCTAPCMVSVTYNSSFGTTYAAPFYDFDSDTAFVGDDSGTLWAITGVFFGTPTVSSAAPFGGGLQVSGTAGPITAPVYDFTSGNIFVGGADGFLYAVNATTGATVSTPVGNGGAAGGLADAPVVDGFDETVLEYAADNAAGVGGATAGTRAVVVQADATTPLGSPQVATVGEGNLGAPGTLALVAGMFDNNYNTYSGSGANTGHFYEIGTAAAAKNPVLYQLSYSGVSGITISGTQSGGASPTVSFSGGGGSGAAAVASGGIFAINVTADGSGYTSVPSVSITDPTGTGATGAASAGLNAITVSAGGTGFTTVPGVSVNGGTVTSGGTAATASVSLGLVTGSYAVASGGSYASIPGVSFPSGSGNASVGVATLSLTNGGSGYTSVPTGTVTGGTHTVTATTQPSAGLNAITVSAGGTGFTTVPGVSVNGGTVTSGGTAATASVSLGLVTGSYAVASGGSYASIPGVSFPSGSGNASVGVATLSLTNGGSGYTSVPTGTVTGGTHTVTATTQPSAGLNAVTVSAAGAYTTFPTVSITGGTGSGAAATVTSADVAAIAQAANTCWSSNPTVVLSGGGGGSGGGVTVTTGSTTGCGGSGHRLTLTVTNGSGYTAVPTAAYSGGTCTVNCGSEGLTVSVGVLVVGNITAGSYTVAPTVAIAGSGAGGASITATYKVLSIAITNPGNYTVLPSTTITFSASGGSGAAATITAFTVVDVNVTAAGTGYTSGPATATFSPTGATSPSIPLQVVSPSITNVGSYTTVPTSLTITGGGGSGATLTATYTVVSIAIVNPGNYTVLPSTTITFSASGGSGAAAMITAFTVVDVNVTAAGTGYTSGPATATFSPTGATSPPIPLQVVTPTITNVGSYTTVPTSLTITGGGGSGATLTATYAVVSAAVTAAGSGYTSPAVSFSGGGGAGAAGNATLSVSSVVLTYGGGGYSTAPTVTICGGTCGLSATATINPGSVMTAGTVPNCGANCTVSAAATAVPSPVDEMFTTGGIDRIYFGYGNTAIASAVVGQTVTNGTISAPSPAAYTVPDGIGGSSAIVLDPVTTVVQANSLYFVEQGEAAPALAIASASAPGSLGANTVTVTMQAPETFQTNDSVTIAGMTCSSGTCPSGPYTITVTSTTTFTFSTCGFLCGKITANADTGTATDPSREVFNAVKLTQTGLN